MHTRGSNIAAIAAGTVALALPASHTLGDVLFTFSDNGSGGTRLTITGTYDLTGGSNPGGTAAFDGFGGSIGSDTLFLQRHSTSQPAGGSLVNFAGTTGSGAILNTSVPSTPSGLTTDFLQMNLAGNGGNATLIVYGPSTSRTGTLNEDIDYASVAYSSFNQGVWEYGDYGGAANDGVRLVIPAPASAALLGLGGLIAARRRRA